jgi:DNA-binding XRE family transcriptional regulator
LAEKVGVSTHHIAMIEIARYYPTLELVERIADTLLKRRFPRNIMVKNNVSRNFFNSLKPFSASQYSCFGLRGDWLAVA